MTRVFGLMLLACLLAAGLSMGASPVLARAACWSGWGYFVEPGSLAFRSDRLLLVTDGAVDWATGERIALYRLDPETGRRVAQSAPIVVRPRQPRFASRDGNRTVDDVAGVVGRDVQLMLGMSRIGPAIAPRSTQTLDWACGRGR
ncbi:hypothetical protein [Rhodovibrio salinarum]|uniref:Uncharacterized protein n=1 Tax=Rhodovibrio salinarum TaxID=1087 RepID=A0A934V2C2_9PROT|nr:hypothetical protein [Rhodovibrio salinarum]MBK1699298.1 hypothetical protein [Rhodovibrio salinarum]